MSELNAEAMNPPVLRRTSTMTVLVASVLTLAGIVGIAVGLGEFGISPSAWAAHVPAAAPALGAGMLLLLSGTALGFAQRRAVLFLVLTFCWSVVCSVMARHGWAQLKPGGFSGFALLYSLYLSYNGRLYRSGPNNSSKPTPLRGAA
ncbi:hypothetical protein PAGU2595_029220 [Lysobacter xanthus]